MQNLIKSALETIPALKAGKTNKVVPVGVMADKLPGALCVYTVRGPDPMYSLSGKLHHYTLEFTADFLSANYDECAEVYEAALDALAAAELPGLLRIQINSADDDAWAADIARFRKRMVISVDWR